MNLLPIQQSLTVGPLNIWLPANTPLTRNELFERLKGEFSQYDAKFNVEPCLGSLDVDCITSPDPFTISSDSWNVASTLEHTNVVRVDRDFVFQPTLTTPPPLPTDLTTYQVHQSSGRCDKIAIKIQRALNDTSTVECDRYNRDIVYKLEGLPEQRVPYVEQETYLDCSLTAHYDGQSKSYTYNGKVNGLANQLNRVFDLNFQTRVDKGVSVVADPDDVQIDSTCFYVDNYTTEPRRWSTFGYWPYVQVKPGSVAGIGMGASSEVKQIYPDEME